MNDFDMDEYFLNLAIKEAKKSTSQHGYHIGAIIVKDNKIISKDYSATRFPHKPC